MSADEQEASALPRIAAVTPGPRPFTLRIDWRGGARSVVDVSGPIATYRLYAPLRQDAALFRQVRVGEHGADIVWAEGVDMAADTLQRLALEQSGQSITTEALRA